MNTFTNRLDYLGLILNSFDSLLNLSQIQTLKFTNCITFWFFHTIPNLAIAITKALDDAKPYTVQTIFHNCIQIGDQNYIRELQGDLGHKD